MPESCTLLFKIAGFGLQLTVDFKVDLKKHFFNFLPFLIDQAENQRPETICEVQLRSERIMVEDLDLTLLTDISENWGNKFKFMESKTAYFSIVDVTETERIVMKSSKDFSKSDIFVNSAEFDRYTSVISWVMMLAFGQSLIRHNGLMLHASVIASEKGGIAFLGVSGTGKSTQSQRWLNTFPGDWLLNDDNPIIRMQDNDQFWIYGTPWSGKTNCYINRGIPLKVLVRLKQSPHLEYTAVKGLNAFLSIIPSCSGLRWNKTLFNQMNTTVEKLISTVEIGILKNYGNISSVSLLKNKIYTKK